MSNNRNLGNIATAITNATSGQVLTSQGSGVATFADAGGGVTYYANVSNLPDSGNSNGDAAFVGANNRLYVFNGVGWYSIALLNQTPTISSVADAGSNTTPFTLSSSGTATVITITATDAEEDALTYNYSVSSGALNGSTVAQGTGAAYAIASASLLSGTMSISSVNGALTFKPDGTKMYTLTTNNDTIGQYDLSTAWDVSTATYNGAFNTQSQVANLTDVKFNTDGTKMFVADRYGTTSNTIYQYTLSTAWDATTASYANKSYDFTSVLTGNDLNCFVFNADGTSVYLAEHQSSSNIYQFTLSTAFDISTASYASKTLSLSSVASNSYIGRQYFQFTNDGSKLFVIHTFHPSGFVGKVYEFSLTTAYDISTASYTNVNYAPSGITASRSALAFKPDGTKMFILGTDNHTTISQFNLPIYGANQFTVTPHASNAATFGLTFTVTDGINTATSAAQAFTLIFSALTNAQAKFGFNNNANNSGTTSGISFTSLSGSFYTTSNPKFGTHSWSQDYSSLNTGYVSGLNNTTTWTWGAWISINQSTSSNNRFLIDGRGYNGSQTVSSDMWLIRYNEGVSPKVVNIGDGQGNYVGAAQTLSTNTWYHLCIACGSTNGWKFYINGSNVSSAASNSDLKSINQGFAVGDEYTQGSVIATNGQAKWDNMFLIYDELTATEVASVYNETTSF